MYKALHGNFYGYIFAWKFLHRINSEKGANDVSFTANKRLGLVSKWHFAKRPWSINVFIIENKQGGAAVTFGIYCLFFSCGQFLVIICKRGYKVAAWQYERLTNRHRVDLKWKYNSKVCRCLLRQHISISRVTISTM